MMPALSARRGAATVSVVQKLLDFCLLVELWNAGMHHRQQG